MEQVTLLGGAFEPEPPRRIQRRKKHEPDSGQTDLGTRMTFKQMEEEKIIRETIRSLRDEIARIEHARDCEQCIIGCVLGIERYMASSLPWYFNMNEEECYNIPENLHAKNYELGYYGNDMQPGTRKFIFERMEWARGIFLQSLEENKTALKSLRKKRAW